MANVSSSQMTCSSKKERKHLKENFKKFEKPPWSGNFFRISFTYCKLFLYCFCS